MLDSRFLAHNAHLQDPHTFLKKDPQLFWLSQQKYIHSSELLENFPKNTPGIYTVAGGRQVGKSTLLKQWMAKLLKEGVAKDHIVFLSGEMIYDEQALFTLIQQWFPQELDEAIYYILLDEVTEIKNWQKAVKFLADSGFLKTTVLMLSGSDLVLMKEACMTLPGRRGRASQTNFHYYPLSFHEYLQLVQWETTSIALLNEAFSRYLMHGGYLTAINDLALYGTIAPSTLNIYTEWLRGDMLKRGKKEHSLKEIVSAIIKHYNSQITWNNLAQSLSMDHPATVMNYCEALASMDAVFIQQALLEDKLVGAPKKARKLMFCDPFIFHAVRYWLNPTEDPYTQQIIPCIQNPELASQLVEACVITHIRRFYPTFYIKSTKEIDVAYIRHKRFYPIEIKWRNQLRPNELEFLARYHHAEVWSKQTQENRIDKVAIIPLVLALKDFR